MKRPKPLPPVKPVDRSRRGLSEAVFKQIMLDEEAPPAARLEAAKAFDACAHGRPGVAHPISTDNVGDLSIDDCFTLFRKLMERFDAERPGWLPAFTFALRRDLDRDGRLKFEQRFVRGPKARTEPVIYPPHVVPPNPRQLDGPQRPRWEPPIASIENSTPETALHIPARPEPPQAIPEPPPSKWQYDASADEPRRHPQMPLTEAAGLLDPPPVRSAAPGYISAEVVARSARPAGPFTGMAFDSNDLTFRDYAMLPWLRRW